MVFNEIDNCIEVYNNSVIELIQCFGTSFFSRIELIQCFGTSFFSRIAHSDQRTRSQNTVFVQ